MGQEGLAPESRSYWAEGAGHPALLLPPPNSPSWVGHVRHHGGSRTVAVTKLLPADWEVVKVTLVAQEGDEVYLRVRRVE